MQLSNIFCNFFQYFILGLDLYLTLFSCSECVEGLEGFSRDEQPNIIKRNHLHKRVFSCRIIRKSFFIPPRPLNSELHRSPSTLVRVKLTLEHINCAVFLNRNVEELLCNRYKSSILEMELIDWFFLHRSDLQLSSQVL